MSAVASARTRKMSSRISGCLVRRSMTTKVPSNATATAANPSVFAEPQPHACALTMV